MEGSLSPSIRNEPTLDVSNGVVRLVREQPPEHCILKVDSFSVLQDALSHSTNEYYISSTEFKAGGFTWVLCVYPKGNEQEDGHGHLSLYVTLVDKLTSGTSVNVALRFYIYDQIRGNYLLVQDIRDKCFHVLKTTWGIPKLLPLESFSDASNGFLVNDCCVFGAEVLVKNSQIKTSAISLVESRCDRIYTWKVENFSDSNNQLFSPVFTFGEWTWELSLYPRGDDVGKGKFVSLYLHLVNADELTHGSKLYTQFCLCIKNQGNEANKKRIACTGYHSEASSRGCRSFLSISDVYDTTKGFLVNDTLIVEVKIEVMLLLKDTDPTRKKIKVDTI